MQTGSGVRCTGRLWALREERGQPVRAGRERRERDQKRKSNLPTPQPHFYSNMRVKRCHSCFQPSLFFSLPLLSFASRFAPSITYSLSLLSTLIVPCLISSPASPTVSITAEQQGEGKIIIIKKKKGGEVAHLVLLREHNCN